MSIIVIFSSTKLCAKEIEQIQFKSFEYVAISVSSKPDACEVVSFYRSQSTSISKFFKNFEILLEDYCLGGNPIVI